MVRMQSLLLCDDNSKATRAASQQYDLLDDGLLHDRSAYGAKKNFSLLFDLNPHKSDVGKFRSFSVIEIEYNCELN